jgi:capsular exopolysaccharide synthesis family protein
MESVIETVDTETRSSELVTWFRLMLRLRWKTFALVSVIIFGLAIALISMMTPKYEATARLRIDPKRNPMASASEETTSLASEAIETEATVLSSPDLAREVVRRMKLVNDPEFAKGLGDDENGAPLDANTRLNKVTEKVLKHLDAGRDKLTYVIAINFKSRDAVKAAAVANAFAQTYIETRVNSGIGTAQRQAEWFRKQLDKASAELTVAQQRASQYRAQAGIVQAGADGTITDQQVAPVATQLATADAAAAQAQSNLQAARSQIARGGLDSVSAVRNSTVINDLRRQRAEVERTEGEITSRYGPKHPESIKVQQQLDALDAQIRAEAQRAIGSLQADASAAEAQASSLRSTLNGIKSQQARDTRAGAIAATLDQDVANKKQAYDRLSQMSLDSTQSQSNPIGQAEIIDRAETPTSPAPPSKGLLTALALVVALAVGLAIVILQEMMNAGMRTVDEVEGRFGLPVLASLPMLKDKTGQSLASQLLQDQTSMNAEAFRNARSTLIATTGAGGLAKIVALTSAVPGEGKSTAALSLARVSALSGKPTLLIDCDVRRAQMRIVAEASASKGLVQLLRGEATLQEVIVRDTAPALDMILVTDPFFSLEDLFGSAAFASLLAKAKNDYDMVVLDLPPVLGLADARTVAPQADVVALAIRWGSTPTAAVERALSSLRKDGVNVAGILFTMVDPKCEAIGGMYYSSKYAAYYSQPA